MGLWIVTSSATFIKSANQSSIKLCPNHCNISLTKPSWYNDIVMSNDTLEWEKGWRIFMYYLCIHVLLIVSQLKP